MKPSSVQAGMGHLATVPQPVAGSTRLRPADPLRATVRPVAPPGLASRVPGRLPPVSAGRRTTLRGPRPQGFGSTFHKDAKDKGAVGPTTEPSSPHAELEKQCTSTAVFVHELDMSPDMVDMMEQLMLLRSIQRSTGLCRSASGAPAACLEPQEKQDRVQRQLLQQQGGFQLVPRLIRGSTHKLTAESFALLASSQVLKAESRVVEADWPLELAKLSFPELDGTDSLHQHGEEPEDGAALAPPSALSVSAAPASPDDVDWLLDASGATALILLQPSESMAYLGVDADAIAERAAERNVPVFHIPMGEHCEQKQASVLPEAVRVLASLLSTGHRVHISCLCGITCSPLVVLGYLTFFHGMEFCVAMNAIKKCCPGASPSYAAWEQAKDAMLAGNSMQRMTELAQAAYQRRITTGAPGSSVDDWKMAQRSLLKETLEQHVTGDVCMSHTLAQVHVQQAEETEAEQVEAAEARAVERTRVLARQVEELQKSRSEAVGAAASAAEQIQFFRTQVQDLSQREAQARQEVADAAERVKSLTAQLEEVQNRERDARAGAAFTMERTEALEEELRKMRELNDSLAAQLEAGHEEVVAAQERAAQLGAQLESVQAMEGAAKDMAAAMTQKAEVLADTVGELEKRLAETHEAAQALDSQLAEALKKDEESQRVVAVLQDRVGKLGKEASVAQDSLRAANTRVQFFFRVMNRLMEREKDAQHAASEASTRLAAAAAEVEGLREKDVLLTRAWQMARERMHILSTQMDSLEMLKAEEQLAASKITPIDSQAQAARQALADAREKEQALKAQVQELQKLLEEDLLATEAPEIAEEAAPVLGREQATVALQMLMAQEEVGAKVTERMQAQESERSQLAVALEGVQSRLKESEAELEGLRLQVVTNKDVEVERDELKRQLVEAQAETRRAREAEKAAKDRSEFLVRQLEMLRHRMSQAEMLYRGEARATETKLQDQIDRLHERERIANEAARAASERAEALELRVAELEKSEARAQSALGDAQEKLSFFFRKMEQSKEREGRTKAALTAARKQIEDLAHNVSGLSLSLLQSKKETENSAQMVHDLRAMSQDLQARLNACEQDHRRMGAMRR